VLTLNNLATDSAAARVSPPDWMAAR